MSNGKLWKAGESAPRYRMALEGFEAVIGRQRAQGDTERARLAS